MNVVIRSAKTETYPRLIFDGRGAFGVCSEALTLLSMVLKVKRVKLFLDL